MPVWVITDGSDRTIMVRQLLDERAQGIRIKPLHPHTLQESCDEIISHLR